MTARPFFGFLEAYVLVKLMDHDTFDREVADVFFKFHFERLANLRCNITKSSRNDNTVSRKEKTKKYRQAIWIAKEHLKSIDYTEDPAYCSAKKLTIVF